MAFFYLLLTVLHAAISANAAAVDITSPGIVQLTRQINAVGLRNLVAHDQARARALKARVFLNDTLATRGSDEPVTNNGVTYLAAIGVGNPPTTCMFYLKPASWR
jgi:cathepsin E